MKTRILMVLLSIILFWSCEKEPILDPVVKIDPVSKFVTVNAKVIGSGGAIDPVGETKFKVGDTKIYTLTPQAGFVAYKVTVDGVVKSFTNNSFSLVADEYLADKIIDLKVEFVDKRFPLITKAPWFLSKEEIRYKEGEKWYELSSALESWIFDSSNVLKIYDSTGKFVGGPYQWSFTNGGLTVERGSEFKEIVFNGEKEMILIKSVPCDLPGIPFVDMKRTFYQK